MSDPRASVGHNSGLNLRPRVKGVNKRQGSQTSGKRTFQRASERETEPELQLPRLICLLHDGGKRKLRELSHPSLGRPAIDQARTRCAGDFAVRPSFFSKR